MVITKFNYFYLMPFIDEFPAFLRNELEKVFETGISDLFDIQDARLRLQQQKADLMTEINASKLLQKRFDTINERMRSHLSKGSTTDDDDSDHDVDIGMDDFESSNYNEKPEDDIDELSNSIPKKPKNRSRRKASQEKQDEMTENQEEDDVSPESDMLDSINLDLEDTSMNQPENIDETSGNTARPKNTRGRSNGRNPSTNNRSARNAKTKKQSQKSPSSMKRSTMQKNRKAVTYGDDEDDDDLFAIKEDQFGN